MPQNALDSNHPFPSVKTTQAADIQLLVLDIDGTLAGESNMIRPLVQQAIQAAQAKGVQVAIATGRMYQSALRFHQEVGSALPLVAYQGALIRDPVTDQVHAHWPVEPRIAAQLLDDFEQPDLRTHLSVHFYIDDRLYVRELNATSAAYAERSQVEAIAVGDLRQVLDTAPTKVLALSENSALIESLFGKLRQRYTPAELYLTKSIATFFEAAHPTVNKGVAVSYLAESLLDLQPENIMVIGDNFNDMEMIRYAGTGVAMGNAPEAVQAIADWVAPSVEEDGVAAAIEALIL